MSTTPPEEPTPSDFPFGPVPEPAPHAGADPAVPVAPATARRAWSPWGELRQDWRTLLTLLVGLAVIGVPLGALWWGLLGIVSIA